jgi:NDP-sugar pyrophosphorylase family protein
MKAMILAAGVGSRMKPLSLKITKPMLKIANKPNLEYIIDLCKNNSISDVMINLHHLPEQVDQHFGNGSNFGLNIRYSIERKLMGTAGSIKRVSSFFDETFCVLMGDGLSNIDLTDMLKFHRKNKSKVTIAVKQVADPSKYGVVVTDEKNNISSFQEKPSLEEAKSNLVNIGIYIIEPEIINLIPAKTEYDFGKQLFPDLIEMNIPFFAYKTESSWFDIGDLGQYHQINMDIVNGNIPEFNLGFNGSQKEVAYHSSSKINKKVLDEIVGPVLIGKNVKIKSGAKIQGPAVIGDNVFIDKNSVVESGLVLDNTYIGKGIEIKDSIVSKNDHISIANNYSTVLDDPNVLSYYKQKSFSELMNYFLISATDKVVAFFALLFLTPLFLVVSLLIKMDSKGPVFYVSTRTKAPEEEETNKNWYSIKKGQFVKYFVFRTMYQDASKRLANLNNKYESGPYVKITDDPRVTKIGKILRKTSIDELPLFWNVLKGDMSLVGIWALPSYEAEFIKNDGLKTDKASDGVDLSDVARLRFEGKLGLAGFWQARGRSNLSAEERALHDSFQAVMQTNNFSDDKFLGNYGTYKGYKSYWKILIETFKSVVLRTGAM